ARGWARSSVRIPLGVQACGAEVAVCFGLVGFRGGPRRGDEGVADVVVEADAGEAGAGFGVVAQLDGGGESGCYGFVAQAGGVDELDAEGCRHLRLDVDEVGGNGAADGVVEEEQSAVAGAAAGAGGGAQCGESAVEQDGAGQFLA